MWIIIVLVVLFLARGLILDIIVLMFSSPEMKRARRNFFASADRYLADTLNDIGHHMDESRRRDRHLAERRRRPASDEPIARSTAYSQGTRIVNDDPAFRAGDYEIIE